MRSKPTLHITADDVTTYLGYTGYASGSVIIPMVLVAMSGELKLDFSSGGGLHFIRSAAMVVSMAGALWAVRKAGKRKLLSGAMFLIMAGLLLCSTARHYWLLTAAIVLIGLGNGLFESLATGFIQDIHTSGDQGRYINLTHSFWPLGILLTVAGSGIYLKYCDSWRYPVAAAALFMLLPGLLYFRKRRAAYKPDTSEFRWKTAVQPLKNPRFQLLLVALFLSGGSEHCFTFWLPSLIELEFAGDGILCGSGVALFAAGMFAGRLCNGFLKNLTSSHLIIGCSLFCAMVSLTIPFINSRNTLLLILPLLGIASGPLWPTLQYFCTSSLREYNPTELYIIMPLFGIPGCGFFTWLLGTVSQYTGLRNGFFIVFFCNLLIAVLIMILIKLQNKEKL